ncbi:hypothetical protein OU995_19785 [Roseateles sp. SL47]|uniref:hypothetical protein n=1 Tax=Roseateles sp. SL47 TaxID=2995138 RepID=UPI002270C12B|nr:hypothetical protein [Roseateles sp. SL47]WAC71808.1 hypothetical protein OU995_19785 [Roseateles sp. SL47]
MTAAKPLVLLPFKRGVPLPFSVGAMAQAEGVPLRAIFDIADEQMDDVQRTRALAIAQSCLSNWLRHAHLGDLEIEPSQKEFSAVEARRRRVFDELATALAQVEAAQRRNTQLA